MNEVLGSERPEPKEGTSFSRDRQSTDKRASRTEKGAYSGVRKKEVTSGGLKSRRKIESFLSDFNRLLCLARLLYSSIQEMSSLIRTKPRAIPLPHQDLEER